LRLGLLNGSGGCLPGSPARGSRTLAAIRARACGRLLDRLRRPRELWGRGFTSRFAHARRKRTRAGSERPRPNRRPRWTARARSGKPMVRLGSPECTRGNPSASTRFPPTPAVRTRAQARAGGLLDHRGRLSLRMLSRAERARKSLARGRSEGGRLLQLVSNKWLFSIRRCPQPRLPIAKNPNRWHAQRFSIRARPFPRKNVERRGRSAIDGFISML